MDLSEIEQRLELMESKLAFQDITLEELNQVITEQQKDIAKFKDQIRLLSERLKATPGSNVASESEETPPPHY